MSAAAASNGSAAGGLFRPRIEPIEDGALKWLLNFPLESFNHAQAPSVVSFSTLEARAIFNVIERRFRAGQPLTFGDVAIDLQRDPVAEVRVRALEDVTFEQCGSRSSCFGLLEEHRAARSLGTLLEEAAHDLGQRRSPSADVAQRLREQLDSIEGKHHVNAFDWAWISAADLAQPMDPVAWAVPGLQLGPGRPCSVQAYGSGAKTLAVQSLVVAAAAGLNVWGAFAVGRPKRVRWLDYEMGRRATQRRFQRLALGLGVDLAGLPLSVSALPRERLTSAKARDSFMRAGDAADIGVIDSCRAATRGVDENDSAIRDHIDLLLEVSEKTGITWIVLHHVGKSKEGQDDDRQKGRGSSALFDAWGAVFDLAKETDAIRKVTMTKPHPEAAGPVEPFYLEISDVAQALDPLAGVVVRHRTLEQVHPPTRPTADLDANVERVIKAMLEKGHPATSIDQIVAWAGMKLPPGRIAVRDAIARDVVVRSGSSRTPQYTLATTPQVCVQQTPHTPRDVGTPSGADVRGVSMYVPDVGGTSRDVGTSIHPSWTEDT